MARRNDDGAVRVFFYRCWEGRVYEDVVLQALRSVCASTSRPHTPCGDRLAAADDADDADEVSY